VLSFECCASISSPLDRPEQRYYTGKLFCSLFDTSNPSQRIRATPLQKPDKLLRNRPLKESLESVKELQKVLLFHPDPLDKSVAAKYCICGQGEVLKGEEKSEMVQCESCFEWYHYGCVGYTDALEDSENEWKCEWCLCEPDRDAKHRWISGRTKAKLRHFRDTPRAKGAVLGGDPPPGTAYPASWAGKVAEIKERSRRAGLVKRKLEDRAATVIEGGGHHQVDRQGMAGLEARVVTSDLIDELLEDGVIDYSDEE
jgi:hypothetical protein